MSRYLEDRTIALGVGGGIAAYRACELARLLMKQGAQVRVVMTPGAQKFVSPLTFQALTGNPVLTDLFSPEQDRAYGHLSIGRVADLFIVAPATADLLARIRQGMADDPLTTTLIATRAPVLLAPAMNVAMWENRQVQQNVAALREDERFHFVGPASGLLADGDVGPGRLAEPVDIVEAAEAVLAPKDLAGVRTLVTAGPTREHLDPVRFISNPSTGRMGHAIARACAQRGAKVTLVSGPVELPAPAGVELVRVESAEEMARESFERLNELDLFIASAAVADQRPKTAAKQKVKKRAGTESLELVRTPDVLAEASKRSRGDRRPFFVGFAAETENVVENAREKLARKALDLIVANDVSAPGIGFASPSNAVVLIDRTGHIEQVPEMDKGSLAHLLVDRIVTLRIQKGDGRVKKR